MKTSLILAGFLGLFLELASIRWLPSNVLSLTYFSNIVLISSFLGLGLGFMLSSDKKDFFNYFPLTLLGVVIFSICLRFVEPVIPNLNNELLWSYYIDNNLDFPRIKLDLTSTLIAVFFLNALPFVLIGQKIASLMKKFEPLTAYTLDIVGSILGIVVFGFLSFIGGWWGSPTIWFIVVGIISLWFLKENKVFLTVGAICVLLTVSLIYISTKNEIWSPYYSINVVKKDDNSKELYVNKFFFQQMIDFDSFIKAKEKYNLPYTLKVPDSVLILGAGTGNDVAIANLNNIPKIDVVELDPVIAEIGKRNHPQNPYQNKNVRLFIDDARSFLKKNTDTYDMIVLGTLDSHALLSAKSTLRLDNFVYTTESLQEIKGHLDDDGIAVLMFSTPLQWLGDKLIKSVQIVFGTENTIVYAGDAYLFNLMIIAGPGVQTILKNYPLNAIPSREVSEAAFSVKNISTDNWPYLYLREHAISDYYLQAIGILLTALGVIAIVLYRKKRAHIMNWDSLNFFCLGAGFLLLETKSITTLSLLFGSTWIVNAFVFGSILSMILLANIVVSRMHIKRIEIVYILLGLSLVLNYFLPISNFLNTHFWVQSLTSAFVVALPIFFASIIFSHNFKSVTDISTMYGLNLIGAVCGGFFEYSSMITGLNFLYVIAGIVYAISYFSFKSKFFSPIHSNQK